MTSIVLTWGFSLTCTVSTINIFWQSNRGGGQAMNVSGNSLTITGLTPGVTYNITLVMVGDGICDSVSISVETASKCFTCMYLACDLYMAVGRCSECIVFYALYMYRCRRRICGICICYTCDECIGIEHTGSHNYNHKQHSEKKKFLQLSRGRSNSSKCMWC